MSRPKFALRIKEISIIWLKWEKKNFPKITEQHTPLDQQSDNGGAGLVCL